MFHSMPSTWAGIETGWLRQRGMYMWIGIDVGDIAARRQLLHQIAPAGNLDHVDNIEGLIRERQANPASAESAPGCD